MNLNLIYCRIKKHLLLPFQDLNALERLVQSIRLLSSILIVIFGLVITTVPYYRPQSISIGRLNTLKANIAKGVFTVLRENIESNGSTDINNGVGLTTSEILVLTSYTFEEVHDIPAYILVTLYGSCDAEYNSDSNDEDEDEEDKDDDDNTTYDYSSSSSNALDTKNNTKLEYDCMYQGPDYLFDYRTALASVGLDIVLEYAYGSNSKKQNNGKSPYDFYIQSLSTLKQHVLKLFFAVLGIQTIFIFLSLWYYYIKGRRLNEFPEKFLLHLLSFLSLFVFVAGTISVTCLLYINYSMQRKITKELEAFGFSYHVGVAWATCMIFWAFFSSVSCLVWSGLEWCVTSNVSSVDNYEDEILVSSHQKIRINDNDDTNNNLKFKGKESGDVTLLPINNSLNGSNTSVSSTSVFVSKSNVNMSNKRTQQRYINNNSTTNSNNTDEDDNGSVYELQSIEFRSSEDSNFHPRNFSRFNRGDEYDEDHYSIQKMVIPSSTIQF